MRKTTTIWVRNNGTQSFKSRYDGEDFEIKPGKEVEMLPECATLCLGFGEEDKTRCLRRLGWAFSHDAAEKAAERLATFSFHMSANEKVEPSSASAPGSVEAGGAGSPALPVVATPPAAAMPSNVLGKLAAAQSKAAAAAAA